MAIRETKLWTSTLPANPTFSKPGGDWNIEIWSSALAYLIYREIEVKFDLRESLGAEEITEEKNILKK